MSFSPDQPEDPAFVQQPATVPNPDAAVPAAASAASAAQPVWARPILEPRWVETELLEYQQLLRGTPRFRVWKPLIGLLLGVVYYFALSTVFGLLIFAVQAAIAGGSLGADALLELAIPDTQKPLSLVMTLGSIALMIPSVLLAMLSVGLSPAGRIWSVALRIRWRWVVRTILPAFAALLVINVVGIGLSVLVGDSGEALVAEPAGFDPTAALWSVLIILLLVPLQSTAEELVFRGAFMQVIGAWRSHTWFVVLLAVGIPLGALVLFWTGGLAGLADQGGRVLIVGAVLFAAAALMKWRTGSPLIAVALPSLVFALVHIYDIWGMLSVGFMALVAAWLAWRTGGLEAAITLHVVNNLVGFLMMTMAFGGETKQTAEGANLLSLVASVLGQVLFAWWVNRDFTRRDGRRTRIDTVQLRGPALAAAAPPAPPSPPTIPAPPAQPESPAQPIPSPQPSDGDES